MVMRSESAYIDLFIPCISRSAVGDVHMANKGYDRLTYSRRQVLADVFGQLPPATKGLASIEALQPLVAANRRSGACQAPCLGSSLSTNTWRQSTARLQLPLRSQGQFDTSTLRTVGRVCRSARLGLLHHTHAPRRARIHTLRDQKLHYSIGTLLR